MLFNALPIGLCSFRNLIFSTTSQRVLEKQDKTLTASQAACLHPDRSINPKTFAHLQLQIEANPRFHLESLLMLAKIPFKQHVPGLGGHILM
jgi:hypothetical protein